MKNEPPDRDPNQGEGDPGAARHYNQGARDFVAARLVEPAARAAEQEVTRDPVGSAHAEFEARGGPLRGTPLRDAPREPASPRSVDGVTRGWLMAVRVLSRLRKRILGDPR